MQLKHFFSLFRGFSLMHDQLQSFEMDGWMDGWMDGRVYMTSPLTRLQAADWSSGRMPAGCSDGAGFKPSSIYNPYTEEPHNRPVNRRH